MTNENFIEEQLYVDFLQEILDKGEERPDRTGTGVISLFSPNSMEFDLQDGNNFPLFQNKEVNYKAILRELLWFISGSTNINDLKSSIWNEWATEDGSIGKLYGYQLRRIENLEMELSKDENKISFINKKYDPLQDTIKNLKENPFSRRHVISLWNHIDLPDERISPQENVKNGKSALPPCHGTVIQFYVSKKGELSLTHYQRSLDAFLGGFFNVASYATLLIMVARILNLKASRLIFHSGDAHIYKNHIPQVKEYISRKIDTPLPKLIIPTKQNILDYSFDDFILEGYSPKEKIKAEISV